MPSGLYIHIVSPVVEGHSETQNAIFRSNTGFAKYKKGWEILIRLL